MLMRIEAVGSRYDVGFAHGRQVAARVRAFADDGLFRLNHLLYEPTTLARLAPTLRAYRDAIGRDLPEYLEELEGFAAGAGTSFEEALLLQLRREIVGYRRVPARGDCTTFARVTAADCVLAQTVDLNGNLETEACVLGVECHGGAPVLMLSFTGLLGYLGMNGHGLAVGLNLVLGGEWRPGIPGYMAIRHLLDTATCVDDCVERLGRIRLASSRSFTVCDGERAATVEILDGERRWVQAPELAHTNHYLDPDFSRHDAINVFARNASQRRLELCRRRLAAVPDGGAGADGCFAILAEHPICVHADGDVRTEATVAAVVMLPRRGEMHVRTGYPCRAATERFSVRPAAAAVEGAP